MRRELRLFAVTAVASLAAAYLLDTYVLQPGIAQVAQVQKARTDFSVRCAARRGQIITLGIGSVDNVSRVCVGPDGRWLEWY